MIPWSSMGGVAVCHHTVSSSAFMGRSAFKCASLKRHREGGSVGVPRLGTRQGQSIRRRRPPAVKIACILCRRCRGALRAETWTGNNRTASLVELPGVTAWVHSVPVGPEQAGGDVHYVSVCPSCIVSRIALADVSGHGPAAVFGEKLRELMQRYLRDLEQVALMRISIRRFEKNLATGTTRRWWRSGGTAAEVWRS